MQGNLTTGRLTLDLLSLSNAAFIIELLNTPGWLAFIGERNVKTSEAAEAYINKIRQAENIKYWVVKLKESDTQVGIISFIKRTYLDHHDIGFAFLPVHSRKGYAYEAAAAVLKEAVKIHEKILATTIGSNTNSISLLQKLGLKFAEEIKVEGETLSLFSITADEISITEITRSFFEIFTNKNGQFPKGNLINDICIPQAIIIKKTGLTQEVYDLKAFIEPRMKILSDGTLTNFEEWETKEETSVSGHIAQRYSYYEKSGFLNGSSFKGKGTKLFQFIKTTEGWKISGVVWEDE